MLYLHPAVLEASVVGAPDPDWGERVVAVVTLRPGAEASEQELTGVRRRPRTLARFKRPEQVTIIDSMPKNAVGKIDKQVVRSWYWTDGRAV